jgi:hypothetical protein
MAEYHEDGCIMDVTVLRDDGNDDEEREFISAFWRKNTNKVIELYSKLKDKQ